MKQQFVLIPRRIGAFAGNPGYGSIHGVDTSGAKGVIQPYQLLDGLPLKIKTSSFKSKRVSAKHSNVVHSQLLSSPDPLLNETLEDRYFCVSDAKNLLDYICGKERPYRYMAPGERLITVDGKDVRKSSTFIRSNWREFEIQSYIEFLPSISHDRKGLTGEWGPYVSSYVKVEQVTQIGTNKYTLTYRHVSATINLMDYTVDEKYRACWNSWKGMIDIFTKSSALLPDYRESVRFVGSCTCTMRRRTVTVYPGSVYAYVPLGVTDPREAYGDLDLSHSFKLDEWLWGLTPSRATIHSCDLANVYKVRQLKSEAFLKAAEDIPVANQNLFQTFGELLGILNDIRKGQFDLSSSVPSSMSDAWLQYRYMYCTNKADVQEFAKFVNRTYKTSLFGAFTIKGAVTIDDITCHCKARLKSTYGSKVSQAFYLLDRYGLCPDFYIVWDFIPYSFIVDWFIPIGDMVERTDASIRYSKINYEVEYITYSLSYSADARLPSDQKAIYRDCKAKCYTRWDEHEVPELAWYYGYYPPTTNRWTWVKRGLDVITIFFGRK